MRLFFYLQKYCSLGFPKADETPSAWCKPSSPIGLLQAEQVADCPLRRPTSLVGFLQAEQVLGPDAERWCLLGRLLSASSTPIGANRRA